MTALSIVVPCFNEEACLPELHQRLAAAARQAAGDDFEIVFVNDGSRDGSWELMQRLASEDPHVVAVKKYVADQHGCRVCVISAQVEAELCDLSPEDCKEFLASLGVTDSGVSQLIKESYKLLGLATYFTAGEKEVRCWTFKQGMTAPQCAAVIHTDFEKNFIRAEVVAYTDLVLPVGAPSTVWQWGTYVHRQHRGRRLGMAVKLENLGRLQADHPQRQRVVTGNDGTNSWMVSINEALGFRIVELCPAYQRKLA